MQSSKVKRRGLLRCSAAAAAWPLAACVQQAPKPVVGFQNGDAR
jgi:hypothetical protein